MENDVNTNNNEEFQTIPETSSTLPSSELPSNPLPSNNVSNDLPPVQNDVQPQKKSKKGLFIGLLIAGVLIIAGILSYLLIFKKDEPKVIVNKVISTYFEDLYEVIDNSSDASDLIENPFTLTADIKLDSNVDVIKDYIGDTYTLTSKMDLEKKLADFDLKISNGSNSLSALASLRDTELYLASEDLIDKVLLLDDEIEYYSTIAEGAKLTTEDIEYLSETVEKAVKNSINEKYLTKNNETITIKGKKVKTTKVNYKLDLNGIEETFDKIGSYLANDSKFVKILQKIDEDITKDDIIDDLVYAGDYENIELNVYTTGLTYKLAKLTLDLDEERVLNIESHNDLTTIIVNDNELKATIKDLGKDSYKVNLFADDEELLTIDIEECNENNCKMKFNAEVEEMEISLELNTKKKNDIYNGKIIGSYSNDGDDVKVTIDYTLKEGAKFATIDEDDAVEMNTLTADDFTKIYSNLDSKGSKLDIYNLLKAYMSKTTTTNTNVKNEYEGFDVEEADNIHFEYDSENPDDYIFESSE